MAHTNTFPVLRLKIDSTGVYVSPDAPLSMRISEMFNSKNWKVIDGYYDKEEN